MVGQGPSRVNDAELIRAAQQGDHAAFEELVRQYDQPVLRLALHLTGSEHEAKDIYQEAFLKVYRNLGSFRFECSFYTWVYRIVSNLCMDYLRRRQVRKEDPSVRVSSEGEEFDLLEQVPDERRWGESRARSDAARNGQAHCQGFNEIESAGTNGF